MSKVVAKKIVKKPALKAKTTRSSVASKVGESKKIKKVAVVKKAKEASRAALKGRHVKVARKIRTSATFRRPKTLRLPRKPKYLRKSTPKESQLTAATIIKGIVSSPSARKAAQSKNTLVLLVDVRANKKMINESFKKLTSVDVEKVRTLIRPDGKKKAFIRLSSDNEAIDVASRLGFTF